MNAHLPMSANDCRKLKTEYLLEMLEHLAGQRQEYAGNYTESIELIKKEIMKRLRKNQ